MKDKVFIDSRNFLNWIPENETGDTEGTKASIALMVQLLEEKGPMCMLVDLSKSLPPSRDQRQIIINALRNNFHNITKVALFGETPLLKAVASFIVNASGYRDIKFFDSRGNAESWLLEKNVQQIQK